MESELSAICRGDDGFFEALHRRADACGAAGRSYVFPRCRLPDGCCPAETTLGLWRHQATYYLYCSPAVRYRGQDRLLRAFFDRAIRRFGRFSELARCLRDLAPAFPAAASAAEPALLRGLRQGLGEAVLGQAEAVETVARRLYGHVGKAAPARPLSLIFYGPTGVGKSELGKAVAPVLNRQYGDGTYQFVWTELNTFTEPHSVYRLTGAPPGYVGYDDQPVFAAVRRNPNTVFMFDELEKAHPEVLKVFMSVLDEGRCSAHREGPDGSRELDFRRCILLFTTNADLRGRSGCVGFSAEAAEGPPALPEYAARLFQRDEAARRAMIRSGALKEIAGRFSGFVGFGPLSPEARRAITVQQIRALGREYGLEVAQVPEALARALTPPAALSVRSSVGLLERAFSALFLDGAAHLRGVPLALEGTAEELVLRPLPVTRSPAASAP